MVKHKDLVQCYSNMTGHQRKIFNVLLELCRKALLQIYKKKGFDVIKNRPEFDIFKYLDLSKKEDVISIHKMILKDMLFLKDLRSSVLMKTLEGLENSKIIAAFLNDPLLLDASKKELFFDFKMCEESNVLNFKVSKELVNLYLFPKSGEFCVIDLEQVCSLKKKLEIALYEFVSYSKYPKTLSIDGVSQLFSVSAKKNSNVLQKIDSAIAEINSVTSYTITGKKLNRRKEKIKTGKGVKSDRVFYYTFSLKRPSKTNGQLTFEFSNLVQTLHRELVSIIPSKFSTLFSRKINYYMNEYEAGYLRAQVLYTVNKNPENFMVYLERALENNYASYKTKTVSEHKAPAYKQFDGYTEVQCEENNLSDEDIVRALFEDKTEDERECLTELAYKAYVSDGVPDTESSKRIFYNQSRVKNRYLANLG